MAIGFGNCYC